LPPGEELLSSGRQCQQDNLEDAVLLLLEFGDNLKMNKWPKCSSQVTKFLQLFMKKILILI